MKNLAQIFTLALMLGIGAVTNGQNELKINYKYSIDLNYSMSANSWTLAPTFAFRKWNKHSVEIGLGSNIRDEWYWPANPFTGIVFTAAYKIYPIGKDHKLNFYFQYNLKNYIHLSAYNYQNYNEHFLGYGFDVPVGNRFYFIHDLGAGVSIESGSYSDVSFDLNLRIGFGCKIGPKD